MSGLHRFFSHWQNIVALAIVAFFIFVAVAAPLLAPPLEGKEISSYRVVDKLKGLKPVPPNQDAILGTVATGILGRQLDVFYTLVWGTRSALRFGLTVALSTALFGVLIGAFSAFAGGWVNSLILRITDAFLAIPVIVGVVVLEQMYQFMQSQAFLYVGERTQPSLLQDLMRTVDPVILALVLFSWMPYTRMTNALVMHVKQMDFVQAARALGASPVRLVLRHLIPNSISPAIVLAAQDIGGMVLMQATLTFIGLSETSEWGVLLSIGRRWVIGLNGNPLIYWWVFVPATLALILFGIGWNLLGDGLNDWLNPRET
jgi:peptide/nickel transport system permease protein